MPPTHAPPVETDTRIYIVRKNGQDKLVQIMQRRPGELYVHYLNTDKRMDEWVSERDCRLQTATPPPPPPPPANAPPRKGRGRGARASTAGVGTSGGTGTDIEMAPAPPVPAPLLPTTHVAENGAVQMDRIMLDEDSDVQQHKQLTAQRNFDMVIFDSWKIKPWYFSPYPLLETEEDDFADPTNKGSNIPGVTRATARSHGRTSDLLAGGLLRPHSGVSTLWVCHFCFKYMSDGVPWEMHKNNCRMKHPPGRKVYQRGAHMIWEVDGAKEKLYCQNLALFGKLFIDVKTLFFDLDNFLFYILTDAKSTEDHIMGFFSKEKLSYDDYNLACIMTLPQYQRKGYGMLLIEFSYELSKRAGKVGTPERPLSDLGLRSYLSFWISTLMRFFRRVLTIMPPDIKSMRSAGNLPSLEDDSENTDVDRLPTKRAKRIKGFDGEVTETGVEQMARMMPMKEIHNPIFGTKRNFETLARDDGGVETHVEVRCTLEDIAAETNLRIEDAAFALNECGLLMHRIQYADSLAAGAGHHMRAGSVAGGAGVGDGRAGSVVGDHLGRSRSGSGSLEVDGRDTILITREFVDRVTKERELKRLYLDREAVLLPLSIQ